MGLSGRVKPGHIIVFGNEKGGSGKSTTAMHTIVALLKAGRTVASIDTDGRQRSLTRYIENRGLWRQRTGIALEMPTHFAVPLADGDTVADIEGREFRAFAEAISRVEHRFEFVVVDTPGSNSYLMRVSHAMADTLVTPVNDSFVDFDVLGTLDPTTFAVNGESHYASMVREARRQRRLIDGTLTDWIVVRNRLSTLSSRNKKLVGEGLLELSKRLGFRHVDGFAERVVYREFFPRGLTALDELDPAVLGVRPSLSHITAREEVRTLLATLDLPLSESGRRRAAARKEWYAVMDEPLQVHDIIA